MKYAFLIIIALFMLPSDSQAFEWCRCKNPPETVEEKQRRAFGIFVGKVDRIVREINPDRQRVEFDVLHSWKGVRNDEVSVYNSGKDFVALVREGITCGYRFKQGETYLVYSYQHKKTQGPTYTSKCGGTKLYGEAIKEVKQLGAPIHSFGKKHFVKNNPARKTPLLKSTPLPDASKLPESEKLPKIAPIP